jgi:hypothetical protein
MAFAVSNAARLPLTPPESGKANDAAGFASRYGPSARSPKRAFDAGLRPDPFPDQAASLLPGLPTATRTGLTPAGDDEHERNHDLTSPVSILLGALTGAHRQALNGATSCRRSRRPHHRRDGLVFVGPSHKGKQKWPSPGGGRGHHRMSYET